MSAFVEYTEPFWRGLNMRALKVDQAYIHFKSLFNTTTYLYSLSDECYTCPFTKLKELQPAVKSTDTGTLEIMAMNVAHPLTFKVLRIDAGRYAFENETSLCQMHRSDMREFGVYNFTLSANGTCEMSTDKQGVNVNSSIVAVFVLVGLALSIIKLSWCAWRSYRCDEEGVAATPTDGNASSAPQKSRMRSLDTFRGMAIVLMIFVNSGGGDYWWIEHAPWNGLHLADIVFPSFLWIMGVCIPISIKSQLGRGNPKLKICLKIIWRSAKLFAIGLCLNSINGPQLEKLRIMGVLQRFGIAFLVCGVLHTVFTQKEAIMPQQAWKRAVFEMILVRGELIVMLSLICVYLGIIFGLPVPGCPTGYLGPGGKHSLAAHPDCIGGAAGYIDLKILSNDHIYQHPTAKYIYDSKAFDPEGIFGCLLTIVQVLLGLIAGMIILIHSDWMSRIRRWISWSLLLTLLGGLLCFFSKEGGLIPVNKNLWSLSFVFVTSSLAFLILSILYWVIDVRKWWTGFPFEESGKNAIVMYVGHTVMHKMLPWHWRIGEMNTHFALLLESVWNTLLWMAIALYLDSKKFYYSL